MTDSSEPKPKVVYVMGAGRSGSTILGVTLGNCENVFFAGELDKWLLRSGKPTHGGEERERFWETVRGEVSGAEDLFGREAQRYFERSSALFRVRAAVVRRRLRSRYRRVTEELYRAIARTADASHVVDTGHYPLRARELQQMPGLELYLLFLVRDPQSVVASFAREDVPEPTFSELKTNAYLWLTYAVSLLVFLRQPRARRMLLRYEDLIADPEGMLSSLLDHIDSSAALPDLKNLHTGLPLQGNRLIGSEVVSLEPRASRPTSRSSITAALQLPWKIVFARLRPKVEAVRSRAAPATEKA